MSKIGENIPETGFIGLKKYWKNDIITAIRALFTDDLSGFLESEEIYHIESNGRAMLIFKSLRIANTGEIKNMVRFTEDLVKHII